MAEPSWIDPETPEAAKVVRVPKAGGINFYEAPTTNEYKLVFSDEFNTDARAFESGFDSKWTALEHIDTTNMGQHYFSPKAVQTDGGSLIITTSKPKTPFHDAHYVSGSVQTWNKFCFTGGYVEMKAILPGKWGIPGTWPAFWIMGNLGRATYLGSQEGMWPWTLDYCVPMDDIIDIPQKINACNNLTDPDDPTSLPEKYGLHPRQGRGATEIDVFEIQIKKKDDPAFMSTSLQLSPGLTDEMRPDSGNMPGPNQWYSNLTFGEYTKINSDYYGERGRDSISALTQLQTDAFLKFHTYRLEWMPGYDGYIRWWLDNNFVFEVAGAALNKWVGTTIPPRMIPVEPSYLIISTAVSEKFSPPCDGQLCDSLWPSNFTIDYVRVYQGPTNEYTSLGCNPPAYPTKDWIAAHPVEFGLPWYTSLPAERILLDIGAGIVALLGLFVGVQGRDATHIAAPLATAALSACLFYTLFNVGLPLLPFVPGVLALLCAAVFGGLATLVPVSALGGSATLVVVVAGLGSLELSNALELQAVAGCFFSLSVAAPLFLASTAILEIVSTATLGAGALVLAVSRFVANGDFALGLWYAFGTLLSGAPPQPLCTAYCWELYATWALFTLSMGLLQLFVWIKHPVATPHKKVYVPFASTDARAWKPEGGAATNLFALNALPPKMQPFAAMAKVANTVARTFGFQPANAHNQMEHLLVLLTNVARAQRNPYVALHHSIFENYHQWCRKLGIAPVVAASGSVEDLATDLCLFFFIWGEASNCRHAPEFLSYLFHQMKTEMATVRSYRDPGFFLDAVITPVYSLLKLEMTANHLDHQDRRNYDDFNEFFWTSDCLAYDYKSPEYATDSFGGPPIATAWSAAAKTFYEKRHWLTAIRAFKRVFEFHIVAFHVLVALAFTQHAPLPLAPTLHILASVLLTPLFLGVFWAALDAGISYHPKVSLAGVLRLVVRLVVHLATSTLAALLYWFAWNTPAYWQIFYTVVGVLHVPTVLNAVLQVAPGTTTWLRQTTWTPIVLVRDTLAPLNKLYVGDNVLDTASDSLGYQAFWVSLIGWKLLFSYKFEIAPLVTPTLLLYADHVENDVSLALTGGLVLLQWVPFFMIFCIDMTIWNSIWVAFSGTFVGFALRIGEVRNFDRARHAFFQAADAFNAKLVSKESKTGGELATVAASAGYGTLHQEVLDATTTPTDDVLLPGGRTKSSSTPLLSFTRRTPSRAEKHLDRRRKWTSFATAWDTIIDSLRADDFLNNAELQRLKFQRIPNFERGVYLPLFQLAGCFEQLSLHLGHQSEALTGAVVGDFLAGAPMVEEAIGEVWELTNWVLNNVLGPCHSNDVRFICAAFAGWVDRGLYHGVQWPKLGAAAAALADVLALLQAQMPHWKAAAKNIPIRKPPSEYAQFQHGVAAAKTAMHKSASTTGLSSMASDVPRRSRGSGVARIAALQQIPSAAPAIKSLITPIPAVHLVQLRDKIRTFLNMVKSLLAVVDEADVLLPESKAMSDRLTWVLTQERGFMWDDEYSSEQLTLLVFDPHALTAVAHLRGLLTLQKAEAEPRSYDARRRLLFFVNSLFMDMPAAPVLDEMQSYSVMTPFYAEDVLYSKADLESKRDGLDVHTLLYLQTLYKHDWENFLERVQPKKNLWKDAHTAQELRLWASLRGQTLARTVQGMMYGEAAIRLLGDLEQVPAAVIEDTVKTKFTYVVACQVYGRQKRNNDPKAKDIEYLLHRFPNLRVAYIDEVRVNYQKELSYFSVLVKGTETLHETIECYRIRLPGNPILGEGKPENQNHAIIFTRGEHVQTIDMNQDGYVEEALKMRNVLESFTGGKRPVTIVGLPEHIFTGSISSLANYMALQETSFVTLGQRTLTRPLRVRMHYGHPDIFNKLFFMTRGGISKASRGINLSEDIFAGYNNCLRGGTVAFPEYIKCGKGRDVGMQQIYKFEAKLAQGAAEQSLSRDVYRLSQRLDFLKLLSFYYNHVGFYLSMSFIIWTVFVLTYIQLLRALLGLEGIGGREAVILSQLQILLGLVAFLTTAPMLATISVERGFKAALTEVAMVVVTGGPLYFLFHIGTKWFYFGQTLLAGGAKYRATGRGFVTKHSHFDDLFRFYASSHLYAGTEIAAALSLYWLYTATTQYVALTWSLWLVVFSWTCSPFWFNPLAFEWSDVLEDARVWVRWLRGEGGNSNQSWLAWFKDENAYFVHLRPWAKACVVLKSFVYVGVGLSLLTADDAYHSFAAETSYLPLSVLLGLAGLNLVVFFAVLDAPFAESGGVRFLKLVVVLFNVAAVLYAATSVPGMLACGVAVYYFGAALGSWTLLFAGSDNRIAIAVYFVHDVVLGAACLCVITVLSAIYVPGKIQTWLLYNNALSRGVVIEDILRANSQLHDQEDDLTFVHMKKIILEQQRVIAALTNGSDSDEAKASHALRSHVSDTDLSELKDASWKLQTMVDEAPKSTEVDVPFHRVRRANSSDTMGAMLRGKPPMSFPKQPAP
ncbi:callose synthase [Achlya hypogyna]|uniref:1,3-beta-glucan synthase n=1 Tax=Achlya hypogyna TaxID=1202772 RepID=A0A1V9YZQ1_ACHHY|nr:callose synthase [Achlya hypogyna]